MDKVHNPISGRNLTCSGPKIARVRLMAPLTCAWPWDFLHRNNGTFYDLHISCYTFCCQLLASYNACPFGWSLWVLLFSYIWCTLLYSGLNDTIPWPRAARASKSSGRFASWAFTQLAKVNCAWKSSMSWAQEHSQVLVDFGTLTTSKQSCRRSLTRNSCLITKPRVHNAVGGIRTNQIVHLCAALFFAVMLHHFSSNKLKLCCFKAFLRKPFVITSTRFISFHPQVIAWESARVELPAHGSAMLHS